MAVTDLIKVQVEVETAFETNTATPANCNAADHLLMGVTDVSVNIMDDVHLTEKSGHLYPSDLASQVGQMGQGSITMDLSYEEINYVLNNFFDAATASTTTTTTGTLTYTYYNRAYDAPDDTAVTPGYLTIEFGAPSANYQACGVLFNELNISGEAGGIWTGNFPFWAQQINTCTMASLSDSAVELIRMADTDIYIDTWAAAVGTTKKADTLISFDLSVSNGRHLKTFAGSLAPKAWGDTKWSGRLTTVAEFNATAKSYVDALLARTGVVQRAIRIIADNDATPTSGNDRIASFDFYGTLVDGATLFEDREGNITVSLVWEGTYNDTGTDWFSFDIKNTDAAL